MKKEQQNKESNKEETKSNVEKHEVKANYYDFNTRLIFYIVAFLILLIFGTLLLNNSLKFENDQFVKYDETSKLDYRVYLLKNDFYEEEYLGKDMLYVSSLIDKIWVNFNYTFKSEDNENLDFDYSIIGKLSITNKEGTKSYFEKSYTLLDKKTVTMNNSNNQNINEQISIDYSYYNGLANNFKLSYGVDSESKMTVYMLINKKSNKDSNFNLDNSSVMSINIPLTQRSVDIGLDYKEINESSTIIKEKNVSIVNVIELIISIVLIIISLIMMIRGMRLLTLLRTRKSAYDKYIEKLLKEYDRLIAESSTLISFENKEIIKINKFTELLDLHDNLQLPIMYYVVNKHQKSYFYINHMNTIYLLTVKAVDIEESDKK